MYPDNRLYHKIRTKFKFAKVSESFVDVESKPSESIQGKVRDNNSVVDSDDVGCLGRTSRSASSKSGISSIYWCLSGNQIRKNIEKSPKESPSDSVKRIPETALLHPVGDSVKNCKVHPDNDTKTIRADNIGKSIF